MSGEQLSPKSYRAMEQEGCTWQPGHCSDDTRCDEAVVFGKKVVPSLSRCREQIKKVNKVRHD